MNYWKTFAIFSKALIIIQIMVNGNCLSKEMVPMHVVQIKTLIIKK
jgi:hypothetical protein